MTAVMQALHITSHGPPVSLRATDVPEPARAPDQVRIAVEAAGINPSDVLSLEGRFPHAVLPRILGRDFAGRVVEGPAELVGAAVWGTGGDLGITRDGTHAEQLVLPAAAVSRRPSNLTPEQAASAGVPFTTAWTCLVDAAHVQAGETVVVSGAVGAVGWAAVELASALGARVIALVKDATQAARVDPARVAGVARSDLANLPAVVREATGGAGAQVALSGVGSPIFAALLESLGPGGRLCVYSAAAGPEVTLNLFDFYRRRLALLGINTAIFTVADSARILDQLRPLFDGGRVRPHPSIDSHPLSEAARAYALVAGGSASKVVLVPRPASGR
ncbi:MAG: zinc-binding alcohol dehydrogenase family protein [Myxococcaceae bacterium]|nr:MAG: zinc-binding alcohol dehydrogenase family protein [Myxococcaceae bacterium]